ncbi:hypothetical protein FRC00_009200 [Tulasnella sp. 408]|nr:hypothetical protein FRC00_009200 [Tulasnella sp. 408]
MRASFIVAALASIISSQFSTYIASAAVVIRDPEIPDCIRRCWDQVPPATKCANLHGIEFGCFARV